METPEIVTKVHDMVMDDRRVIERCIASDVGITQEKKCIKFLQI